MTHRFLAALARAMALGIALLALDGAAAARPVTTSTAQPSLAAAVASGASGALAPGGPLSAPLDEVIDLFGPHLEIYGQRAVLRWYAAADAVLSVDFGETPALGQHAVEPTQFVLEAYPLRGGAPASRMHEVSLDGLQTGSAYHYRGTLTQGGAVIADTGVLPFETPLAFVRVRPVEIAMAKDGDHDVEVSVYGEELYDSENKGEVYIEWSARVKAAPGAWPWGPKAKGCYPGGAALDLLFPDAGEPDAGGQDSPSPADDTTYDPTTGVQTPTLHGDPQAWAPIDGCVAYRYDTPVRVDEAKIGSGAEVALAAEAFPPMEWELPAELPGEPVSAIGSALALDKDGDGEPDGGPDPSDPAEPVGPCGDDPPGSFAFVRLSTRGQEFDYILLPGGLTRIINHDGSETDDLCLDLREPEQTLLKGVRVDAGSLEFTTWFEVALDYRLPDEAPPAQAGLQALGTPIVIEPGVRDPLDVEPIAADDAEPDAPVDGRPQVSLHAKRRLRETKKSGAAVKVTRIGDTSFPMFVGYTVGGTAGNGVDFRPLLGSVEIPAGKRSAKIVVLPIDDAAVEGPETVELELLPDYGYAAGDSPRLSIELVSDDR
jgi:hypothetical protein